ncbi:MAG: hypothetical protein AAF962_12780 [Actinomycetota bacterium]
MLTAGRGEGRSTGADQVAAAAMPDPFVEPLPERGPDLATSLGAMLALLGFVIGARVIGDNSFLTHLATGRLILDTASVPTTDPYSWSAGESWTVQSWLASVLYASLESAAGPWAIRWLNGVLGAVVVGGLWALTSPVRSLLLRTGLVSLTIVIGTFLWPPRPLLFALACLVLVLLVAQGRLAAPWLVPVFWVWANTHGSFVLGGGLLVLMLLGAAIDERAVPRHELRVVLWGAAGGVAALANPIGWRLIWFPLHLMGRNEALDRVAEWASPSFRSPVEQLFLLLLLLLVVAATRRAGWRALLPSVVFFATGLLAVRNLGVASVVIVALLAPALAESFGSIDGTERGLIPRAMAVIAVVGVALVAVVTASEPAIDLESYPVEEVDWLEERDLVADPGVRLAQRDFVGNYLHHRYGPEASVFMDDRFDFHPLPVVADHAGLLSAGDYREILDRNGFDVLLWELDSPLHRWIGEQPAWLVVGEGEEWFIACRRSSAVFDRCTG